MKITKKWKIIKINNNIHCNSSRNIHFPNPPPNHSKPRRPRTRLKKSTTTASTTVPTAPTARTVPTIRTAPVNPTKMTGLRSTSNFPSNWTSTIWPALWLKRTKNRGWTASSKRNAPKRWSTISRKPWGCPSELTWPPIPDTNVSAVNAWPSSARAATSKGRKIVTHIILLHLPV